MKSPVVKRSIVIAGHKTSVSLEDAFWMALKEIAAERDMLSSSLRIFRSSCSQSTYCLSSNQRESHVRVMPSRRPTG